ncbi:MAG: hypothetical protein H6742_21995 [Alphaproteobacteria bacterium]|nr:hypothetical protein [Alphaproteobacteria bacterium]
MRTIRLVLLALPLAGCSTYLSGGWDGEWDCTDYFDPFEIEMDVTHHGLGDHSADMTMSGHWEWNQGGEAWVYDFEADYLVEIFAEGTERQDLTYTTRLEDYDCELVRNGIPQEDGCGDAEDDEGERVEPFLGIWSWDGSDEIEMEDPDNECDGVLER